MPYMVHSHIEQAVAQCDAAHLTRMNAMQKQINTLEGYLHAMFGSMYEEEMHNLVQTINELKAQMAQMIKQYQPRASGLMDESI